MKKLAIFLLTLGALGSVFADGPVSRPRPADSTTNAVAVNKFIYPVQPASQCPSGQVYSGGQCVDVSSISGGGKSWVSYFLGQCKTTNSYRVGGYGALVYSATTACIRGDGTTYYSDVTTIGNGPYGGQVQTLSGSNWAVPSGTQAIGIRVEYSGVGAGNPGGQVPFYPLYTNAALLSGGAPYDFVVGAFVRDYVPPQPPN